MDDALIYAAMQEERPYKSYRKTTLGQVYVTYLNPFDGSPEGKILKGTKNNADSAIIDLWSPREDAFFRRMNKRHFEQGYLVEYHRPENVEIPEEEKFNTLTDDEISKLLSDKSLTFQNALNKMTSEAILYRVLQMAREQEKSEKIITRIEARLSEVQQFQPSE